jgi:hypothetical protein
MIMAEIAKKLVDQYPELMLPANKERLLALVEEEFRQNWMVLIKSDGR